MLGTIEEAKEGSTGDESETETITYPQQVGERERLNYGLIKKKKNQRWHQYLNFIDQDEPAEVTEGREEKKEEMEDVEDEDEQEEEEACTTMWESHPDVDGGWAWVILIAMFGVFVITSGTTHTHYF